MAMNRGSLLGPTLGGVNSMAAAQALVNRRQPGQSAGPPAGGTPGPGSTGDPGLDNLNWQMPAINTQYGQQFMFGKVGGQAGPMGFDVRSGGGGPRSTVVNGTLTTPGMGSPPIPPAAPPVRGRMPMRR
jgi:hypothetical protein